MIPRPGDVLIVDGDASVQFAGSRWLLFRVISVGNKPTYHGWLWLQGYSVDKAGHAIERREIFVRHGGLRYYRLGSAGPNAGGRR